MLASTGPSAPRGRKAAVRAFAAAATLALLAPAVFAQDVSTNLTNTGDFTNVDGSIFVAKIDPTTKTKTFTASITKDGAITGTSLDIRDGQGTGTARADIVSATAGIFNRTVVNQSATFNGGANFNGTSISNVGLLTATTVAATTGSFDERVDFKGGADFHNTDISNVRNLTANSVAASVVSANVVNANQVSTGDLFIRDGGTVNMGGNVVHGVADPIAATDAANKRYVDTGLAAAFKEIDKNTQGIAIAMAMSGISLADNKNFTLGANVGFFDDKQAIAVQGALRVSPNLIFNMGIGTGFQDTSTVGGRVGLSASW